MPTGFGGAPQQSLFCVQSSSCGLQPDGGWQMFTPVVPSGPHESEQHLLSQPAPVQTEPAGLQGALPTIEQRPSVAPAAFVQSPPQHSKSFAQTSPDWLQNETFLQWLVGSHWFEQQSELWLHVLPSVRQEPPAIATHFLVPAVSHLPLQHSASVVQASATGLSALHCVEEHVPPTHETVQQSVLVVHFTPGPKHPPPPIGTPHLPTVAPAGLSHVREQQSVASPHD